MSSIPNISTYSDIIISTNIKNIINKQRALSSGDYKYVIYPGAFITLYEQIPPPGFAVRDGSVITEASINAPLLYNTLQLSVNKWKLKDESEWQEMSSSIPFEGIGGVPFFVLDIDNDTIRLPDTRGMHEEGADFINSEVGTVYGDMIRNISGKLYGYFENTTSAGGAMYIWQYGGYGYGHSDHDNLNWAISASIQAPTGPVNRPKSFETLHCVYIGEKI